MSTCCASLDKKLEFIVREATRRFDIKLRFLDRKRFKEEVQMFLHIYNASLDGTWGFTPLSAGEIEHMSASMRHLIVPELTTVAEVDGRPVAAAFGLLDYNPRIRLIDGRLFPFGFIRLLSRRRQIKRIRMISTNVLPEYQRWGLGVVVLARLVPHALKWGIQEAEFSWVLESNHLSYKSLKRGGAKLDKTYRIYDYPACNLSRGDQPGRCAVRSDRGGEAGRARCRCLAAGCRADYYRLVNAALLPGRVSLTVSVAWFTYGIQSQRRHHRIGVVSPIGIGEAAYWDALCHIRSGVVSLESEATRGMPLASAARYGISTARTTSSHVRR